MPREALEVPWGSISTNKTFFFLNREIPSARLVAVADLPTPPFILKIVILYAMMLVTAT
jgi:hypothetical protein